MIVEGHPQIWGAGLHALEMCLAQGYVMTALDALPLWFLYGYTRTKEKKNKGLAEITGKCGNWEVKWMHISIFTNMFY